VISIDTNVLLRYLLQDDKKQAILTNRLINKNEIILITDIVLIETLWTLKGKKYNLDKEALLAVIESIFKEPNLVFENGQLVWRALNTYRSTQLIKVGKKKKDADFADILILEKSKYLCSKQDRLFQGFYSFDIAAQQIDGIEKPG